MLCRTIAVFYGVLQEQKSQLGMKNRQKNRQVSESRRNVLLYDLLLSRNKKVPQTLLVEKV